MEANQNPTQGRTEYVESEDGLALTCVVTGDWQTNRDGSCTWPNGAHTVLAAAEFNNPFGDPIKVGTPPTDAADQGTPGGATLGVTLKNLTVEILGTSNGTVDWLRYDPDGNATLSRPTITYKVDCWRDTSRTVVAYLIPTQKQGVDPLQRQTGGAPGGVAYIETCQGNGTYTTEWNGAMYPGDTPDSAPWGTYAFDVYAYDSDMFDWTSARLPYTLGVPATVTRDGQQIPGHQAWIHENTDGSRDMRFGYQLASTTNTPPASVLMTCLDGELAERGALAGDAVINQYKAGADGQGYIVAPLTADDIEVPPWRVILTGVAGSGAECRRDRQNPRMLAVNGLAGQYGVFQLWVNVGATNQTPALPTTDQDLKYELTDYQWGYVANNMGLLAWQDHGAFEMVTEPLPIYDAYILGGHVKLADLSAAQRTRAAKLHVAVACRDDAPMGLETEDTYGGAAPNTRGTPESPDRMFINCAAVKGQSQPYWLLPNSLLHELGHSCGLGHGTPGKTVMPPRASENPSMTKYLYMLWKADDNSVTYMPGNPCAWGEGIVQNGGGQWSAWNADTAATLKAMRRHCGIKAN